MRPIKINITKAHIRDGERGSECNCPIALALKDTLLTESVRVNSEGIVVNGRSFKLDKKDRTFMSRFDNYKQVRPYSFSLIREGRK